MSASSKGRTIVIGVDSMDLLLIERWAAAGYLPFFAAQLRDCSLVRLSTPTAILQGALWPDLIAGRSPGHHGTYFLTQLTNGTYDLDRIRADRINAVPYYGFLDAHGVRCAVVDFPHVMPIEGFRGLHIVDWLSEFQTWQFTVQPPEHEQDLVNRFGILRPSGGYGATVNSLNGHRELRRKLETTVQMKTALVEELLGRDDLDHICVVYGEAHKAGHFLWKYMDPTHPDHVIRGSNRDHRPGGFVLARGPDIRRGVRGVQRHLLQLPPTLLALHGVPRPDHYEMHALDELLVESANAVPSCIAPGAAADSLLTEGCA